MDMGLWETPGTVKIRGDTEETRGTVRGHRGMRKTPKTVRGLWTVGGHQKM